LIYGFRIVALVTAIHEKGMAEMSELFKENGSELYMERAGAQDSSVRRKPAQVSIYPASRVS
jgi:hypothetical protein